MLTMRASTFAGLAVVSLLSVAACKMIEDVKEIGGKVQARFPGDGPKVSLSNGRKIVVNFDDPDTQLAEFPVANRIRAAAEVIAGIMPEAGKIDSVEVVVVKYGVGIGAAQASIDQSESFSVSDLKRTRSR